MEENKTTKKPEMKIVKGGAMQEKQEPQKLTYEQLNDACNQLFQQNQQLRKKLDELNTFNAFKRLDYLLKVIELANTIKDADFINGCIEELKEAIVIKPEQEVKEETTKK